MTKYAVVSKTTTVEFATKIKAIASLKDRYFDMLYREGYQGSLTIWRREYVNGRLVKREVVKSYSVDELAEMN